MEAFLEAICGFRQPLPRAACWLPCRSAPDPVRAPTSQSASSLSERSPSPKIKDFRFGLEARRQIGSAATATHRYPQRALRGDHAPRSHRAGRMRPATTRGTQRPAPRIAALARRAA